VTAHEADVRARDIAAKSEPLDQLDLNARRRESRAGHHDDVIDVIRRDLSIQNRSMHSITGERRRKTAIGLHPLSRCWPTIAGVFRLRIEVGKKRDAGRAC